MGIPLKAILKVAGKIVKFKPVQDALTSILEKKMSNIGVSEEELVKKAVAPRVTKGALDANVKGYAVFNVHKALTALGIPALEDTKLLTIAIVTAQNGFNLVGESACASPENYDEDIGNRLALGDATQKLWPLMGYHLKQTLFEGQADRQAGSEPQASAATWEERLWAEKAELEERLTKLGEFLKGDLFVALPSRDQRLLVEQKDAMSSYLNILVSRLNGIS